MDDPSRYRSSVVDQCYESYQSCGAAQFVTAASHCGDTTILADKPFPWQASAINLVADHVAKQGGRLGVLVVAAVGMGKTLAAGGMLAAWERQSPVQKPDAVQVVFSMEPPPTASYPRWKVIPKWVPMSRVEREAYEVAYAKYFHAAAGLRARPRSAGARAALMAAITQLRLIGTAKQPRASLGGTDGGEEEEAGDETRVGGSTYDAIKTAVISSADAGRRVMVYGSFVEILRTLKADVEAALGDTCRYGIITGSVTAADRARVVEQYKDADDSRGYVVFLSPAAEAAVDLPGIHEVHLIHQPVTPGACSRPRGALSGSVIRRVRWACFWLPTVGPPPRAARSSTVATSTTLPSSCSWHPIVMDELRDIVSSRRK